MKNAVKCDAYWSIKIVSKRIQANSKYIRIYVSLRHYQQKRSSKALKTSNKIVICCRF